MHLGMRLLIVTQVMDATDTYLGFFVRWVEELALKYESIEVICLYEGEHALPQNVTVHSLGKERGAQGKGRYVLRFLSLAWRLRGRYDRVLVHMNEEYVLVAGLLWKLLQKPAYLWRNHYAGSVRTHIAALLADKVFYTSMHSYTARFKNAVRMPVGVDLKRFAPGSGAAPGSILFLGRFSSSKRPDLLVEALGKLKERGVPFSASFYGTALPEDAPYRKEVIGRARALGLDEVRFHEGVPHMETAELYRKHDVYVNLGASGMLDKALFEAAASGVKVIARSEDWRDIAGEVSYIPDDTSQAVADAIATALSRESSDLKGVAEANSLDSVVDRLVAEMA